MFAMVLESDGRRRAAGSSPPPCPDALHEASAVIRHGTYGKRTSSPRQRYRFLYGQGRRWQRAVAHVHPGAAQEKVHEVGRSGPECDQVRGTHHGEAAVAHGHAWSARVVARGLDQLSMGASYADTDSPKRPT